jgi:hypothetical protein
MELCEGFSGMATKMRGRSGRDGDGVRVSERGGVLDVRIDCDCFTHHVHAEISAKVVHLALSDKRAAKSTPPHSQAPLQCPRLPWPIGSRDVEDRPCWDKGEEGDEEEGDEVDPSKEGVAKGGIAWCRSELIQCH